MLVRKINKLPKPNRKLGRKLHIIANNMFMRGDTASPRYKRIRTLAEHHLQYWDQPVTPMVDGQYFPDACMSIPAGNTVYACPHLPAGSKGCRDAEGCPTEDWSQ